MLTTGLGFATEVSWIAPAVDVRDRQEHRT